MFDCFLDHIILSKVRGLSKSISQKNLRMTEMFIKRGVDRKVWNRDVPWARGWGKSKTSLIVLIVTGLYIMIILMFSIFATIFQIVHVFDLFSKWYLVGCKLILSRIAVDWCWMTCHDGDRKMKNILFLDILLTRDKFGKNRDRKKW